MDEITKVITNFGLLGAILVILFFISFKYIPKFLDLKLKRLQEHDDMMDSFKAVLNNNSQVINNNSEVIRLNTSTIKNYTENSHKLEKKIEGLTNEIQDVAVDIKILKERK